MSRSAWGALLLVCSLASAAVADSSQEQAERLFKEGRAALAADDPQKACDLFQQSIAIDPTATGVMLNLGLCYEKLGKVASSLKWFRKAQFAAAEAGNLSSYEQAAKDHTTQLSPRVSILTIRLADANGTEVRVDNRRLDTTEYARVEVDAGTVQVVASSPEKVDFRTEVTIAEGETKVVDVTFQGTVLVDTGKGRRRTGIILGVTGLAALAGVGVWGFKDQSEFDELETKTGQTEADRQRMEDLQFRQRWLNSSLFTVGIAAVGVGVYLYLSAPGLERRPAAGPSTAFTPVIGPDNVGFALDGTF